MNSVSRHRSAALKELNGAEAIGDFHARWPVLRFTSQIGAVAPNQLQGYLHEWRNLRDLTHGRG
jgi:hypothetical protein